MILQVFSNFNDLMILCEIRLQVPPAAPQALCSSCPLSRQWLHNLCARPSPQPQLQGQSLSEGARAVPPWTKGGLRPVGGVGWGGVSCPGRGDVSVCPCPCPVHAALRRARREEQLVSKRLLRGDGAAQDGAQDGADVVPEPLSEDEVKNRMVSVAVRGPPQTERMKEPGRGWVWEWF